MAVRWRADQPDDPPPVHDFIPTMVGFSDEPNVIFGEEKSGENQGLPPPLEGGGIGGVDGVLVPESILKHDTPVGDAVVVAAPVMRLEHYPEEQPQQQQQQQQQSNDDGEAAAVVPEAKEVAANEEEINKEQNLGWRDLLLARVRALFPVIAPTKAQAELEQEELAGEN